MSILSNNILLKLAEFLRSNIRNLVGWDSLFYKLSSSIYNGLIIIFREGFSTWLVLRELEKRKNGKSSREKASPVPVIFRILKYPFLLRPGTNDIHTAINNFIREEYGKIGLKKPPDTLIDAGAYIGDTAAYFLSRFPNIHVIAIEPNPESLELAKKSFSLWRKGEISCCCFVCIN